MSKLILFDIDGTIAESSQQVSPKMISKITEKIEAGYDIGIVGGGTFEKVTSQLGTLKIKHYFTECGCVYHTRNSDGSIYNVYKKNIRQHPLYPQINILVKEALQFLAKVDYEITGHFIDLRNGIIYISLIGMVATLEERARFIELNNKLNYRKQLINILKNKAWELKIENEVVIAEGGTDKNSLSFYLLSLKNKVFKTEQLVLEFIRKNTYKNQRFLYLDILFYFVK